MIYLLFLFMYVRTNTDITTEPKVYEFNTESACWIALKRLKEVEPHYLKDGTCVAKGRPE